MSPSSPDPMTMVQRSSIPRFLTAVLVLAMVVTVLAAVPPVGAPSPADASTAEDDANWVPFIGDHELWCTSGNPGYSGCQTHHLRPAMDIGMPVGVTIRAAGNGVVEASGNDGDGRGTYVQIQHADGRESHYYHLSSISVTNGQSVTAGQPIGKSGSTGVNNSPPHLHYEEKNASGTTVEPGVMHSVQNGQLVDYPTAGGTSDWLQVPYGTRIINESYEVPLFIDVTSSTWNHAAIAWAVDAGVATGYPDKTWRNSTPMNRAQGVMWTWRTAAEPEAAGAAPHGDAPPDAWYRPGLDWAAGVPGMVEQFGATFEATTPLTRGQLAVLLWARAGKPPAASAGFTDVVDVDQAAAANWMAARGYMVGYDDATFRPDNTLTRGEGIMALYRERLFDDVNAKAWNRLAVDWGRWRAFVVGFNDHTFRAANSITRAQAVTMLWREAGSPTPTTSAGYTDLDPWYTAAADWAAGTDIPIATGYEDGTFRGNEPIKRQAFVMMLWRRASTPTPGTPHGFTDIPPGAWYEDGASWAAEHGVVTGYGDNTFRGALEITRGQSINSFLGAALVPG